MFNIFKVKKDDIINFDRHFHFICKEKYDFSYQIGKIISSNNHKVIVNLEDHFKVLLDSNNCLYFTKQKELGDFYKIVKFSINVLSSNAFD